MMTSGTLTAQQVLSGKESRDLLTVRTHMSVQEACKLMRRHAVGCLVVTGADGKVEGIFTERDVVNRLVAEDKDASDTQVLLPQLLRCAVSRHFLERRERKRKVGEPANQRNRLTALNRL